MEAQLTFDFDEYEDTNDKCEVSSLENIYYNAIQAIKENEKISDRFEKIELINGITRDNQISMPNNCSSFIFKALDSTDDKKVILKCLNFVNEEISNNSTIDFNKVYEWENAVLSYINSKAHCVKQVKKLEKVPIQISTEQEQINHSLTYFALEYLPVNVQKSFFAQKQYSYSKAAEKLRIFCQILNAVYALHNAGIFHRDIKPSNIMAKSGSHDDGIKIIDLGSCYVTPEISEKIKLYPIEWYGTTSYEAPEKKCGIQHIKDFAPLQDMYSLGCLLYELLGYKLFDQQLLTINQKYCEVIQNCSMQSVDNKNFEKCIEYYTKKIQEFAPLIRPVEFGEETDLPQYVKTEIEKIMQSFTNFDYRKRPTTQDLPEIRSRIYRLIRILQDAHLQKIYKKRKIVHKRRLLEQRAIGY